MKFNKAVSNYVFSYIKQLEENQNNPLLKLLFNTPVNFNKVNQEDYELDLQPGVIISDQYYFINFSSSNPKNNINNIINGKFIIPIFFYYLFDHLNQVGLKDLFLSFFNKYHKEITINHFNDLSYNPQDYLLYIYRNNITIESNDPLIKEIIYNQLKDHTSLLERNNILNSFEDKPNSPINPLIEFLKKIDCKDLDLPYNIAKEVLPYQL